MRNEHTRRYVSDEQRRQKEKATSPTLKGFNELNVWLSLGGLSVLFFVVGWWRGAYQFVGKLHPKLERPLPQTDIVEYNLGPLESETLMEFQKLTKERYKLRMDIKTFERKSRVQTKSMMDYYQNTHNLLKSCSNLPKNL